MPTAAKPPGEPLTYAKAGVDLEAADHIVELIRASVRRTHGPRVFGRHGGFAGMFRLDFNEKLFQKNYREPVLVACADGVGRSSKFRAAPLSITFARSSWSELRRSSCSSFGSRW